MRSHRSWWLGVLTVVGTVAGVSTAAQAQPQMQLQEQQQPQGWDEPWFFTADLGVVGPLNDPLNDQFDPGGEGSLALYRSFLPELAFGAQLRVGLLGEGAPIAQDPVNRGPLDYGILTANVRVRPFARLYDEDRRATGLFLEASAGGSLLDGEVVPAFAASLGYGFGIGDVSIAPKVRFTHFIETEDRFGDNDVFTLTGGLEIALFDRAQPAMGGTAMGEGGPGLRGDSAQAIEEERAAAERAEQERLAMEREEAELAERQRAEQQRAEQMRAEQEGAQGAMADSERAEQERLAAEQERAQAEGGEMMENHALVVDERVFFDFDRAELRTEGRQHLDQVVEHYRQYGDRYESLVVSGHTDRRGAVPYNEELGRRRAEAVVAYLVSQGVPRNMIDVRAYGELRPEVLDATSELDHQINRRVEFEVVWAEGQRPEGIEPEARPTMPERVDEAPMAVRERENRPEIQAREAREREQAVAELERANQERIARAEEQERVAAADAQRSEGSLVLE
jgi:OOP family OmpA-OmpF porin